MDEFITMPPHQKLEKRVTDLLEGSLGLSILPDSVIRARPSGQRSLFRDDYLAGLQIGLLYALFFCAIPWLLSIVSHAPFLEFSWSLFFLQIYGSFWSGWATASTRMASSSILKTVKSSIIPELSAETAEAIYQELTRRFERARLLYVSWGLAVLCAAVAGGLIYCDAPRDAKPPIGEIVWWSVGWWILFATAAKVVNVGSFYRVFAAHLEDEPERLYAIDPARSTLVINIASIGQTMLLFWFGIAVSIVVIIPFAAFGSPATNYSTAAKFISSLPYLANKSFVLAEVPIAGFFSIGLGTIVFLRNEAAIRRAVKKASASTLRLIEMEVGNLSELLTSPQAASLERLEKLKALHNDVAKGGSYRSLIVSGLSLFLPFIPLASLVKWILSWLGLGNMPPH
jgi:hypothetical protein